MLSISQKARIMPLSPVRKLVPFSDAAKKRGVKVYHLNIGQPDVPAPREALEAVKSNELSLVSYTHSAGNERYREGMVEYYRGIGVSVSVDDIIVTTGGSEAILIGFSVCFDPGDEVLVMEPFYTNYSGIATWTGVVLRPVACDIRSGFALPPIDAFERAITPRTRGIVVCNPNNPTGYLYSRGELEQLAAMVRKHGLYLFADEVYREFCYTDAPHVSCMELAGMEEHVVLIDSVSKRYSLCGVRIGAIVSRNRELMQGVLRFAQARLCSPAYGQIAAEGALRTPPAYFAGVRKEYIARRDYMVGALNAMDGVFCPMPQGAFYTVVRLPVADCDVFAQWLLEEFVYEGQTVMIAPASGFYVTPGKGLDEARIAYVLNVEDLKRAMRCLEVALKRYDGGRG
ncbi:MAG: pyridoxal phosphate-dependent aminotransferase [Prevotellaceae bacterium]|jgi:aspartate aminotransferase|nr:pyridoxal phosphate-dependent aminotransferase [Prevotellaceae bacterium]